MLNLARCIDRPQQLASPRMRLGCRGAPPPIQIPASSKESEKTEATSKMLSRALNRRCCLPFQQQAVSMQQRLLASQQQQQQRVLYCSRCKGLRALTTSSTTSSDAFRAASSTAEQSESRVAGTAAAAWASAATDPAAGAAAEAAKRGPRVVVGPRVSARPFYFDYQATTPVDPRVLDTMMTFNVDCFGNPHSGSHAAGWEAKRAVERSRSVRGDVLSLP